jgi:hypothetical protein
MPAQPWRALRAHYLPRPATQSQLDGPIACVDMVRLERQKEQHMRGREGRCGSGGQAPLDLSEQAFYERGSPLPREVLEDQE